MLAIIAHSKNMFIKQLNKTTAKTKYGDKEKWLLNADDGKTYDSFIGLWNKDWQEGQEIEVKETQITNREYNGKTYWSIQAPPEAKRGGVDLEPVMEALRKIYAKLNEIESRLVVKQSPLSEGEEELRKAGL
jgi:hypothetical protein